MPIQEGVGRGEGGDLAKRRDRPILLVLAASLRRWSSLNLGFLPSCSFKTLTSYWRYSITFCWLRLIQPAIQMRKTCRWFTAAGSDLGCHLAGVSAAVGQEPWQLPDSREPHAET